MILRSITVLPYINRVNISVGKYYSDSYEFDINLVENNDFYQVYKIIGDTSELNNKDLVYMVLKGYEGGRDNDIFEGIDFEYDYRNYSSQRSSTNSLNFTHLYPPIELLTSEEYIRNPYRFRNFRLEYDSNWKIVADGNLVGKGYILYQSNEYFDCLDHIRSMAGPDYADKIRYYVVNENGHYDYFEDVNAAVDEFLHFFSQKKECLLGVKLSFDDYIFYANQEYDLPIVKPSFDYSENIYFKKVDNQPFLRANPILIDGINIIINKIKPSKMIDFSYQNNKICDFTKSFFMQLPDKEKKVR